MFFNSSSINTKSIIKNVVKLLLNYIYHNKIENEIYIIKSYNSYHWFEKAISICKEYHHLNVFKSFPNIVMTFLFRSVLYVKPTTK